MKSIRVVNVRGLNRPEQRTGICYVGRKFAGWSKSPWHNPFTATGTLKQGAIERFKKLLAAMATQKTLEPWLAELWEECEHGLKPLGCWCVDATAGDGSEVVCHAQVLAEMLRERFVCVEGN